MREQRLRDKTLVGGPARRRDGWLGLAENGYVSWIERATSQT